MPPSIVIFTPSPSPAAGERFWKRVAAALGLVAAVFAGGFLMRSWAPTAERGSSAAFPDMEIVQLTSSGRAWEASL